jgi:hypothetical protein
MEMIEVAWNAIKAFRNRNWSEFRRALAVLAVGACIIAFFAQRGFAPISF